MNYHWLQPARKAAGSPETDDRVLDGAAAQELPPGACARTQHWVNGTAVTDRRWLEAMSLAIEEEAAGERTST